jgi:hypothetical protein
MAPHYCCWVSYFGRSFSTAIVASLLSCVFVSIVQQAVAL